MRAPKHTGFRVTKPSTRSAEPLDIARRLAKAAIVDLQAIGAFTEEGDALLLLDSAIGLLSKARLALKGSGT